jgi:hypothetical protein
MPDIWEYETEMDDDLPVILHRTSKDHLKEGITYITKGEGVPVFDREGPEFASLHLHSSFTKKN